jgi:hypothetical protein
LATLVAIDCEPGQARKGAAVAVESGARPGFLDPPPHF